MKPNASDSFSECLSRFQAVIFDIEDGVGECGPYVKFKLHTRESGLYQDVYFSNGSMDKPGIFSKKQPLKQLSPFFISRVEREARKLLMRGGPHPWMTGVPFEDAVDDVPFPKERHG